MGKCNGRHHASELMNQGRNGVPNNVQVDLRSVNYRINQLEQQFLNADPRTALARQALGNIRRDLQNGNTSVCH